MADRLFVILLVIALAGCVNDGPAPSSAAPEPVGTQIVRASPQLKGQRFSNMLNFEAPTDIVFITPTRLQPSIDSAHPHSGQNGLKLDGGKGSFRVKLSSLLGSRPFPGDWTMAGGYFFCTAPAQITVAYEVNGVAVTKSQTAIPPGEWTGAFVDLTNPMGPQSSSQGIPSLSFSIEGAETAWCDDVMLIDNTQWIVGGANSGPQNWTLSRRGFNYVLKSSRYVVRLATTEFIAAGWNVEEASPIRTRFSSNGQNKSLTVYPDGRSYWDGKFRSISAQVRADPAWEQQHASPAQIEVPPAMGRVNRNSTGDENNDGYNELRGAYVLIASGGRLDLTMTPQSSPIMEPLFEISGLPDGKPLVTIEGRLIENAIRLEDGTWLISIPGKIDRATTVNVRIQ